MPTPVLENKLKHSSTRHLPNNCRSNETAPTPCYEGHGWVFFFPRGSRVGSRVFGSVGTAGPFLFLVGIPGLSNTPSHWLICSGGQWRPLIFKRAQPRASARHDRAKSGRPGNQSPPAPRRSGQVVDIFRVKEKPRNRRPAEAAQEI